MIFCKRNLLFPGTIFRFRIKLWEGVCICIHIYIYIPSPKRTVETPKNGLGLLPKWKGSSPNHQFSKPYVSLGSDFQTRKTQQNNPNQMTGQETFRRSWLVELYPGNNVGWHRKAVLKFNLVDQIWHNIHVQEIIDVIVLKFSFDFGTPLKMNGWNLKITQLNRKTSSIHLHFWGSKC